MMFRISRHSNRIGIKLHFCHERKAQGGEKGQAEGCGDGVQSDEGGEGKGGEVAEEIRGTVL